MSTHSPEKDCSKQQQIIYKCGKRLAFTTKYREHPQTKTSDVPQGIKDKAKSQIPAYEKTISRNLVTFVGTEGGEYRERKAISPERESELDSSGDEQTDDCCGEGKGTKYPHAKGRPYRRPATNGPKDTLIYKFCYIGYDDAKIKSAYSRKKEYYRDLYQQAMGDRRNCCKYLVGRGTGCSPNCLLDVSNSIRSRIRMLDNAYNNKHYELLCQLCGISVPVKNNKPIKVKDSVTTIEYQEVVEQVIKYLNVLKCTKDSTDTCCCESCADCRKPCEDRDDCDTTQEECTSCEGYYQASCCKNNCTDPCNSDSDCTRTNEKGEKEKCNKSGDPAASKPGYSGCCTDSNCRYGEWEPSCHTVCSGEQFEQTRYVLDGGTIENNKCEPETRNWTGCKTCDNPDNPSVSTTSSLNLNLEFLNMLDNILSKNM